MRKFKRKKIRFYRVVIYVVLFILIALTINSAYSYIIKTLNVDGTSSIKDVTTVNLCEGKLTYELNSWNSSTSKKSYRVVFTLENTGEQNYNDWNVYIKIPEDFELNNSSSVDAEIIGTRLKLSSVHYNSYIQTGNSVTFEIQFTTANSNYEPTLISINNCYFSYDNETTNDNLDVKFNFVGKNDTFTYQYDIVVTNASTATITNWSFNLKKPLNSKVVNAWNANYIVKDSYIEFSNMSYNGTLTPGSSATFGLIIYAEESLYNPELYE